MSGYYAAKFEREAKENPTDWLIKPTGRNCFVLVYVGVK